MAEATDNPGSGNAGTEVPLPEFAPATGAPSRDTVLHRLERLFASHSHPRSVLRSGGHIDEVSHTHFRVRGLTASARLGDIVEHHAPRGGWSGEIVRMGVRDALVAPFERNPDAGIGDPVYIRHDSAGTPHASWRGRVIDALGKPVDEAGPVVSGMPAPKASNAPSALSRQRVADGLRTGVRVVDIFTPICFGQRIGIFAGSGVGKSTLLAMLAHADAFDTVVVALVGERGREVREFLEDTIGADGLKKTVAVVATSDESAMMRKRAPDMAIRVAEHFRDRGDRVLLVLDSITRFAHALREVAIGIGEPPVARGYPASVFTELPKLLERAGPGIDGSGSITAVLSVLVDGDDHNDPVADCVRGILDGHVVLDRAIAEQGRFPAVDPLASISRLAPKVWTKEQQVLVSRLRGMMSRFEDTRDIRLLGAYQPGADPDLDAAVRQVPAIYEALCQSPDDGPSVDPFSDLARHLRNREAGGNDKQG